jgi:predicted dinucleotide-binding enzyme
MKIAILGAGNVGAALASAWSAAGHTVVFGARDPQSPKTTAAIGKLGLRALPPAKAAQASEIVVLATPWPATRAALESCGSLAGKTLIDCTNPLKADLSGLELGADTSGAERVASWSSGAHVFKCFNQTGAENMAGNLRFSAKPVMFVAGDHAPARPTVLQLARDAGFEAVDAGPLTSARLLEPLAMLWIHLAYRCGLGREYAFALTRRS